MMVGRGVSFSDCLFLGAMSNVRGVYASSPNRFIPRHDISPGDRSRHVNHWILMDEKTLCFFYLSAPTVALCEYAYFQMLHELKTFNQGISQSIESQDPKFTK